MIGGEFPIAVTDVLNAVGCHAKLPDIYTFSSGRAALYQILKYLRENNSISKVLLPDYLCSSILVPIKKLGLDYAFYPIDEQLVLNPKEFSELYTQGAAVLLINYFGLMDLKDQINTIRSIDDHAIIIEDDVQAYYEFLKPLNGVDFKFTSLRKTFAVPDGGLVKSKYHLPEVSTPNSFGQYKAAAGLLKSMRDGNFNDKIYLDLFQKGESIIDDELELGMSSLADKLYYFANEAHVKVRRLNNAHFLIDQLEMVGIKPFLPLIDGHVPLFIPICIENREKVRNALFQQEIFCPVHWPQVDINLQRGKELADKEISLIIDQRYGYNDMADIVSVIKANILIWEKRKLLFLVLPVMWVLI